MKVIDKIKNLFRKNITYTPLNGICKWNLSLVNGDDYSWDYWGFYPACYGNKCSSEDAKAMSCAMYTVLSEYLINRITLDRLLKTFDEIMKFADFNFCEKCGGKIVIELDSNLLGLDKTINTINTKHLTLN